MKPRIFLYIVGLFLLGMIWTACKDIEGGKKKSKIPVYLRATKSVEEMSTTHNKFERMKLQILGHFSNKDQVKAAIQEGEKAEPVQEFIIVPIMDDRPGEFWVYLEFFSPDLMGEPIDQRVEQYVQVDRDTFTMEVYYLKDPKRFVNAWKNEKFPKINIKEDLIRDEKCDLTIIHQDDKPGTFKTVPPDEITCEMLTSTTAARYVDLEYETDDEQYLMWFKFYDKNKKHLKTTDTGGQIFKRQDPMDPRYQDLTKTK
ncbi:MAG: chromophore lyase CpcT/CpeT [Saprospiraceae bacterium]|nr:chromophore lyase CpcT/CpeT [Saprospiraceae bacterium]